jgi:hypothetical protein
MNALTTNRLHEIAETVKAEHAEIEIAMRESLARAVKVGELLTEAKQLVKHGEWGKWITDNCQFSERTAQNYMRIHERFPELAKAQPVADLTYREAVGLLAEPKPDNPLLTYEEFEEKLKSVDKKPGIILTDEAREMAKELFGVPLDFIENIEPDFKEKIRRLRELAAECARRVIPGTYLSTAYPEIIRLEMGRVCGGWIIKKNKELGKEKTGFILKHAGTVANYAMYAGAYFATHKALPEAPAKIRAAVDGMDFPDLMGLGEDCITLLTVNHDELCDVPESAKSAWPNDPASFHWCVGLSRAFELVEGGVA